MTKQIKGIKKINKESQPETSQTEQDQSHPETSQPEASPNQDQSQPEATSTSLPAGDHIDQLIETSQSFEGDGMAGEGAAMQSGLMSKDDFYIMFCACFKFGGFFLKSAVLQNVGEIEHSQDASNAIYDTIIDIPYLHFLLKPEGRWTERAFAVLMFGMALNNALQQEKKIKLQMKENQQPQQKESKNGKEANETTDQTQ